MKRLAMLLIPVYALPLIHAQNLPEGEGKRLVEEVCTGCHGLDAVTSQRATKEGWQSIVDYMVARGATAKDEDIKIIVEYLAKNFPPESKKIGGK
jgi:cytochrome c5